MTGKRRAGWSPTSRRSSGWTISSATRKGRRRVSKTIGSRKSSGVQPRVLARNLERIRFAIRTKGEGGLLSRRRSEIQLYLQGAVEEHDQNPSWRGPESWSVGGLRDALLSWIDVNAEEARRFVSRCMRMTLKSSEKLRYTRLTPDLKR